MKVTTCRQFKICMCSFFLFLIGIFKTWNLGSQEEILYPLAGVGCVVETESVRWSVLSQCNGWLVAPPQ